MINFRKIFNPIKAREKRYQKICQLVNLQPDHKVLDLGCGEGLSFVVFNKTNKIVGLDVDQKQRIKRPNFSYVQGDGEKMGFKDEEFDLVICIGVLEHIVPFGKLERMAQEIQRVGKSYVIVVPHFYTIVEPHYQLPFWQFYPDSFKSFLIKHFNIGWYPKGNGEDLNYFTKEKWLSLFPQASIISYNHILGLIWDYIIFKK